MPELDDTLLDLVSRVVLLEEAVCALSDTCAELRRRIEELERRLVGYMSEP